jgi:hypothetical protein
MSRPTEVQSWVRNFHQHHKLGPRLNLKYLKWTADYLVDINSVNQDPEFPLDEKAYLVKKEGHGNTSQNVEQCSISASNQDESGGVSVGGEADSNNMVNGSIQTRDTVAVSKTERWREQSRSLKTLVLNFGILSATCQGWYQSVVSGTCE